MLGLPFSVPAGVFDAKPSTPEPESEIASSPAQTADKSRFKFQKLLQPFTADRAIVPRFVWVLLDWLVLGVAISSLLVVEAWWVKAFASLVAAIWIARLFVIATMPATDLTRRIKPSTNGSAESRSCPP